MKARALAELFTHVENCVEDGTFHFKFSVLHQLYENHLWDFGFEKETNRTWFQEKVLTYFPKAQEQSDGKNTILVCQQGMQQMLKQAMACDYLQGIKAQEEAIRPIMPAPHQCQI